MFVGFYIKKALRNECDFIRNSVDGFNFDALSSEICHLLGFVLKWDKMNDFDEIFGFFAGFKGKVRVFVDENKLVIGNYCLWEEGFESFNRLRQIKFWLIRNCCGSNTVVKKFYMKFGI